MAKSLKSSLGALPLDSADVVHVENILKPTFAHRFKFYTLLTNGFTYTIS